jgi:hypothetical protein
MSQISSLNSSSALSLPACPDNGHSVHPAGGEVRAYPADGLHGLLGMYRMEENGQTRYVTQAELAAIQRDQCKADGGSANVVRSDNHRELLRQSMEDSTGQCPTEDRLDQVSRSMERPGGFGGFAGGPDAQLRQDAQNRIDAFGRTTVKLETFHAPGWEAAGEDPAACFKLACKGAQATATTGDSATGGGGVVLYEKTAQRIQTDADASRLALDKIREHVDAGRAVVAGVNEPATSSVVDARRQPVTDHFVAVYGYETDAQGKITALLAKDNAVAGTAEVRFEVRADGSIAKPAEPRRADEYLRQEYQMSEVRFHTSAPYSGTSEPTNDAGQRMVW